MRNLSSKKALAFQTIIVFVIAALFFIIMAVWYFALSQKGSSILADFLSGLFK